MFVSFQSKCLFSSLLFSSLLLVLIPARSANAEKPPVIQRQGAIAGEYIVVLREGLPAQVPALAQQLTQAHGGVPAAGWQNVLKGFLVLELNEHQAEALARNPNVKYVEQNYHLRVSGPVPPDPTPSEPSDFWFLDRSDRRPGYPTTDGFYNYCTDGNGSVSVYVLDTRINGTLPQFEGRVRYVQQLYDYMRSISYTYSGQPSQVRLSPGSACHEGPNPYTTAAAGHGTAVASVLAADPYGIAPGVEIVDTGVFDCLGWADAAEIVTALDWIATDASRGSNAAVVNASFTSSHVDSQTFPYTRVDGQPWPYSSINAAVDGLYNFYGVITVAAAGNFASDVYWYHPAGASQAITVAGMSKSMSSDTHWPQSNYGSRVDYYAPAQYIEALHNAGPSWRSQAYDCNSSRYPYGCTSGTSFAAPIVAGAVARYMAANPSATRAQVKAYLDSESVGSVVAPDGFSYRVLSLSDCPTFP